MGGVSHGTTTLSLPPDFGRFLKVASTFVIIGYFYINPNELLNFSIISCVKLVLIHTSLSILSTICIYKYIDQDQVRKTLKLLSYIRFYDILLVIGEDVIFIPVYIHLPPLLPFNRTFCILITSILFASLHVPGYGYTISALKFMSTIAVLWAEPFYVNKIIFHVIIDVAMFTVLKIVNVCESRRENIRQLNYAKWKHWVDNNDSINIPNFYYNTHTKL